MLLGSPASSQLSTEKTHTYFTRLTKNNDLICLQEIHGKDEFLQAIQVLAPQFRLYFTFIPNNLNAGGSAILPEGAVVTRVIPCQGRDHIVTIQSGERNLVVVNVHFEPDLTLRNLRARLHLITPHWPRYPESLGVIMVDFNVCEPEGGRFNSWNQTFSDGDAGKVALFRSRLWSHHSVQLNSKSLPSLSRLRRKLKLFPVQQLGLRGC